ncbi:RecB family exonuclease [Streptomyces sp. NPDC002120]|uniref:RecB family exonuclease n=1 Tax=Streptomyces sp. NPDC002120 TaxID=3364631 RepID=UPI0036B62CDC
MSKAIEERAEAYKTKPRSVSQVKQYNQCAYGFYLARIAREPELQAAWLPMGVAVHSAAELWEKSSRTAPLADAEAEFTKVYTRMANESLEREPDEAGWQASGPYKGFEDLDRRYLVGLDQVGKYVQWYKDNPDERIWVDPADSAPAIEQRFDLNFDGVKVIGFIDQVLEHPKHGVHVRDIKTGVIPAMDDTFQLDTYALAVNRTYGTECASGDFWAGKTGRPSRVRKLDVDADRIAETFVTADQKIKAGDYRPNPGEACGRCPVQRSCQYSV